MFSLSKSNHEQFIFIGAPPGTGKKLFAEYEIYHMLNHSPDSKIFYISPKPQHFSLLCDDWRNKFGVTVSVLSRDVFISIFQIESSTIIMTYLLSGKI